MRWIRGLLFPVSMIALFAVFAFCAKDSMSRLQRQKSLANALVEKELNAQAIEEYRAILASGRLGLKEEAGISLRMAELYMDKLNQPENALVCYMRVREFLPGSDLAKDAEKRMIECLEETGRYADARFAASKAAALKPQANVSDPVLASFEGRTLTRSQVERMAGPLRGSHEQNRQTVRSVLASELLAQSAQRKGLDRKPAFTDQLEAARRSILAQSVLDEKLAAVRIDSSLADEYFTAHKERYGDSSGTGKTKALSFDAVKHRVIADMQNEKKQETAQGLIEDLLRQADVKVFDDKIP